MRVLGYVEGFWSKIGILRHLAPILGLLGAILGASWVHLGAILGPDGASWGHLGDSWEPLGAIWGTSELQKARQPLEEARVSAYVDALRTEIVILRQIGAILGLSWDLSGPILGTFGGQDHSVTTRERTGSRKRNAQQYYSQWNQGASMPHPINS